MLLRLPHPAPSAPSNSAFVGFRFPAELITVAVRWYLRFGLSYRDVEELLAERDIEVDPHLDLPVGSHEAAGMVGDHLSDPERRIDT